MNFSLVIFILGWVVTFLGGFLMVPALTGAIYHEQEAWLFFLTGIISAVLGFLVTRLKPKNKRFFAREGYVICAATWIVISLIGAVPLALSKYFDSYLDALFEIVSGFTTTGSSILEAVTGLPRSILIWRSFSHWIGGMGVLVFILSMLPLFGGADLHLMKAESPGPSVGKLVPNVKKTAAYLYEIYLAMTVLEFVFLLIAGMPVFDAICISMGTAGTGGFGVVNESCGNYTTLQQSLITIFMMAFGVNFNMYFLILKKHYRDAFQISEVRWYFAIFFLLTAGITCNRYLISGGAESLYQVFHHAAFNVATVMTTTGFGTQDFTFWPAFSRGLLILGMVIGACAGSTGGGVKVSRVMLYFKSVGKEFSTLIHPRSVRKLKVDGKVVDHSVLRSVNNFLMVYVMILIGSVLLVLLDPGTDFETGLTAVIATLNNIGPGMGKVGPAGNFHFFNGLSKSVFIFDMLAGRLELFPLLLLFYPSTWKNK